MASPEKRHAHALIAAAELSRLRRDGRLIEAEQVMRTIDDLVGFWKPWDDQPPGFMWPTDVAEVAGVPAHR